MKNRCYNPKVPSYRYAGAMGVQVCAQWRNSFPAFLADVGARPGPGYSIDRWPDNNGDYTPGNVRWATASEQQRNKRPWPFRAADCHGEARHFAKGLCKPCYYAARRKTPA